MGNARSLLWLLLVLVLGACCLAPAWGADDVEVPLTEAERAWLAEHPTITFGPDPNWPPYEQFDANGTFVGISAELLTLVAKRLGVTFEFVRKPSWDAVVAAVKAREIDCYSTAVATQDRKEYMLFTRPHVTMPGIILARTDAPAYTRLEDLHGKKVAIVSGYWWEEAIARDHPEIRIVPSPDIATALGMLSFGSVDAMLNDPATSAWYLQELDIRNVRLAARLPGATNLAVGVRKDWPLLRSIIDKALGTVSADERQAIENRWTGSAFGEQETSFPWLLVGAILAVVFVLVGGVLFGNRMLKAKIAAQTDQLRAELARREEVYRAVARTTVEVTGAATQLGASAREQADTAGTFHTSAMQAATAVTSIAATLDALLEAVEGIHAVAEHTTRRAEAGRQQLDRLDGVMRVMATANQGMGERVVAIQKSAEKIKLATVMMVKVVDQTNLLSVNSAIEAEKAGDHGRGFRIVSQEIQRLADQSAGATLQIEGIVRSMQDGVEEGVREARAAREQVADGVEQADHIGTELGGIMEEIGRLTRRFEQIRGLVADQSRGTETIRASIEDVESGAQAVHASSAELADVSQSLQQAIQSLRADVSELGEDDA